jgi:Flp pilus assembly CpaF family ATPase
MLLRYYSVFDGQPSIAHVKGDRVAIGRSQENDIILQNRFVDPSAVQLNRRDGHWFIQAIGVRGIKSDGRPLRPGQQIQWNGSVPLTVFPYVFHLQENVSTHGLARTRYQKEIHQLVRGIHVDVLRQLHLREAADRIPETTEELLDIERMIEAIAAHFGLIDAEQRPLASELAGHCVRDEILTMLLERQSNSSDASVWLPKHEWNELATAVPAREDELNGWTLRCTKELFKGIDDEQLDTRIDRVELDFWRVWDDVSKRLSQPLRDYLAMRQLKKQLKDMLYGFGPLEDLLRIPTISEIMVNASDEIFIEKSGVLQNSGRQFVSDKVTRSIIERIVGRVGRHIDTAQPMVDARLPDGSRVNAVIPPLAVKGPCLTIRKFGCSRFSLDDLIEMDCLTPQVAEFLEACVRTRRSILVSGGTGSGKTTMLNLLSEAIPRRERIICIEDTHELQLNHPNLVFAECRDGNNEGKGKVVIRDLLKNALRQRPDRLIIGECRGEEALDMLQAMNTGHDGSMTTIHANHPADALRRLEVLVRDSGLPNDAIRQQIVSAIDVIVQLRRDSNGKRRITEVTQVVRFDEQTNQIKLRTLFDLRNHGSDASDRLTPTGCIPTFANDLIRTGGLRIERFLEGIHPGDPATEQRS